MSFIWMRLLSLASAREIPCLFGTISPLLKTMPTMLPEFLPIADGINGHPVVHFDGNDTLAVSRSIDNRYTILTVSRLEGTQNFRLLTSKTQNWIMGYWNNYEDVFYTSGWATDQVNTATSRAHLYTVTNNGKVMADARLFANGLDITDDPLRPRGFVGNFQMGGWSQGRELSIGDVAEVIAYERQLTDGERRAVEAYLLGKYGLSEQIGVSPVDTQAEGEYMVTYGATDAAGNTTVKTRKIIVKANPATPVITLVGETILEHQAGYEFTEPGFNLSTGTGDALDADLVDVQGSVYSLFSLSTLFATTTRMLMVTRLLKEYVTLMSSIVNHL